MNKLHKLLAIALAFAMSLSLTATAFAAETPTHTTEQSAANATMDAENSNDNGGATFFSTKYYWVGNSYTTIATKSGGINGQLYITVTSTPSTPNNLGYNGLDRGIDVLMFDANNNVVWRGDNVFGISNNGSLWCGPNVTRVDMRIAAKIGTNGDKYRVQVTY